MTQTITTSVKAHESLELQFQKDALDHACIVSKTDARGRILYVNQQFCEISGYSPEELIGQDHMIVNSGKHDKAFWREMYRTLHHKGVWQGTVCNRAKDGSLYWVRTTNVAFKNQAGRVEHFVSIRTDITEQKKAEEQIALAAKTDRLTGLPNRSVLYDQVYECLEQKRRNNRGDVALLFLDFDRFKLVNDTLGHDAGDELLKQIGSRLTSCLRGIQQDEHPVKGALVTRFGGDEFVIVLKSVRQLEQAEAVAEMLLRDLNQPYDLCGHKIRSGASIGIAISRTGKETPDDLIRDADTAMYEAKSSGKNRCVVFDLMMRKRLKKRVKLEQDLQEALDRDEFFLAYQPIVETETGKTVGAEALVRWKHPHDGLIPPNDFVPIAEDCGLIVPIGDWVIKQACSQFMEWQRNLGNDALQSINVNLSRLQLAQPDLPDRIRDIFRETGINPRQVKVEITENCVMQDPAEALRIIQELKQMGVQIAIDDFGTGHSSLSCLNQFSFDCLKIDRAFIKKIDGNRDYASLVHAIAILASNLGITVVAEGVETPEQLAAIQAFDCQYVQGYLFGKPMLPDEFANTLSPSKSAKLKAAG